jgi:hypothetical protein
MKLVAACWLFLLTMAQGQTVRLNWKPLDFQPLTELPWKDDGEPQDVPKIIERIFREPNPEIRYPVLGEYLRKMPMLNFALAFDIAVMLEGTQTPNELVALMLRIWAERDPQGAWERTQTLVHLVGFDENWLTYDSWNGRPKIEVQDLAAIRASRYWLGSNALLTFPQGVEDSDAPKAEKVRLLKAFADLWLEKFQVWPRERKPFYEDANGEVVRLLDASPHYLQTGDVSQNTHWTEVGFEAGGRRWLNKYPQEWPEIVKRIRSLHWAADPGAKTPAHDGTLSEDFLLLWAQTSPDTLEEWAGSPEEKDSDEAWQAKCILMANVDKTRQQAWIAGIMPESMQTRMRVLARWCPELAMEQAFRVQDADMICDVARAAVYGFGGRNWNRTHAGLGFVQALDLQKLPKHVLEQEGAWEWNIYVMEQWGCVDIGETARHGYGFLMKQTWPPRDELLRFFSGEDVFPDESGVIDRTFCALRVWAVWHPDEMRAWIVRQKGAAERKALTWLLEHPWGNDEPEEKAKE